MMTARGSLGLVGVVGVVGIVGLAACVGAPAASSSSGTGLSAAVCARKHAGDLALPPAPPPAPLSARDCSIVNCGTNGIWLGAGVQFRTLHLRSDRPNESELAVISFSLGSAALRLDVVDDELLGIMADGTVLSGEGLVGAVLGLGKIDPASGAAQVVYTLTIRGVWEQPFQVACTDCRPTFHGYRFEARYAGDGCEARVCAPGLDPDATPSLRGDALVFRGDVYTDTHEVRSVDDLPPGNDDLFNIACTGTTVSKMHVLRHTTAAFAGAGAQAPPPPSRAQRQALMRMLTADYCGVGKDFTRDGTPLRFTLAPGALAVPDGGAYAVAAGDDVALDAVWTPSGAACIGTPRLVSAGVVDASRMSEGLKDACMDRTIPSCSPLGDAGPPWAVPAGSVAVSGFPKPLVVGLARAPAR